MKFDFNKIRKRIQAYQWLMVLWLLVILMGVIGFLSESNVFSQRQVIPEIVQDKLPSQQKISVATSAAAPSLSANSVWVFDRRTESEIYQLNSNQATAPASLVKMMTAIVAHERLDWEEPVPINKAADVEGNTAKFLASDVFLTKDLIKAMLLFSANDAATALATHQHSQSDFINWMNEKAQQLGLNHTHFSNVTGMDDDQQKSTAKELGLIANHLLSTPALANVVREEKAIITEQLTKRQDVIYTTNSMLSHGDQFQGVKTGTTQEAGQNLVLRVVDEWPTINGHNQQLDLIIVLLGSEDRYQDAMNLIQWLQESIQVSED